LAPRFSLASATWILGTGELIFKAGLDILRRTLSTLSDERRIAPDLVEYGPFLRRTAGVLGLDLVSC